MYFNALLSFSDLFMSIYLLIIGISNFSFKEKFFEIEHLWTASMTCHVAGFFISFSLLCSTGSLLMISVQRYSIVTQPMKKEASPKKSIILIAINITLSVFFSLFPLIFFKVEKIILFLSFLFKIFKFFFVRIILMIRQFVFNCK